MPFETASLVQPVSRAFEHLGPLSSDASLHAIAHEAARLPDVFDAFGFEVPLAEDDDAVDFGLRLDAQGGGYARLREAAVASELPLEQAWRRIAHLACTWSEAPPLPAPSSLFVELDTSRGGTSARVPSVFLHQPTRPCTPRSLRRLEEIWCLLPEDPDCALSVDRLRDCLEALSFDGAFLDLGVMTGRSQESLRLHVALPLYDLEKFLIALGLGSRYAGVEETAHAFGRNARGHVLDHVDLQVDFEGADDRGISLEYALPVGSERLRMQDWEALLSRFERHGMCSHAKSCAVLDWADRDREDMVFGLGDVKIEERPGQSPRASAYLYVEPSRG